jgi:hypothetical protein
MHVGAVARNEIKHPGSKIIGAEQIDFPLRGFHHFFQIDNVHAKPSSQYQLILAQEAHARQARLGSALTANDHCHMG